MTSTIQSSDRTATSSTNVSSTNSSTAVVQRSIFGPRLSGNGKRAYFIPMIAEPNQSKNLEKFLGKAAELVRNTESETSQWFALKNVSDPSNMVISVTFMNKGAQEVHFAGEVPKALSPKADELIIGGMQDGFLAKIQDLAVLSECLPRNIQSAKVATNINIKAAAGQGDALAQLLASGGTIVTQTEPLTLYWRVCRLDAENFSIFDVFEDDEGVHAHFSGKVAEGLKENEHLIEGGFQSGVLENVIKYNIIGNKSTAGKRAYWMPMQANKGQEEALNDFLKVAADLVKTTEPHTSQWFALSNMANPSERVICDTFDNLVAQKAHFLGEVPKAFTPHAHTLLVGGMQAGLLDNVEDLNVISESVARTVSSATLAMNIKITAAPGQAENLEALLKAAGQIVTDTEPLTLYWRSTRLNKDQFQIFDIFATEEGMEAHFEGHVAGSLMQNEHLVDGGFNGGVVPHISKYEIIVSKDLPAKKSANVANAGVKRTSGTMEALAVRTSGSMKAGVSSGANTRDCCC